MVVYFAASKFENLQPFKVKRVLLNKAVIPKILPQKIWVSLPSQSDSVITNMSALLASVSPETSHKNCFNVYRVRTRSKYIQHCEHTIALCQLTSNLTNRSILQSITQNFLKLSFLHWILIEKKISRKIKIRSKDFRRTK